MKVRYLPAATRDIETNARWYEAQSEGLGDKFVLKVLEAVDKIALNPLGYEVVAEGARRCIVPRFQDAIWFIVESDQTIVIACLHSRRDRKVLKERTVSNVIEMPRPW